MIKRFFDIASSLAVLLAFGIPIIIISILIKWTSKGPIVFWSQRVGRNNEIFLMPKFRTMVVDAPLVATYLLEDSLKHLTPLGRILRRTSLDELPQIYSILKGDMSVVGPRPVLFNEFELNEMRTKMGVHTILPGLTGLAQVNGRDDLTVQEKVVYDAQYVHDQSFWLDVKIIFKTIHIVLTKKGIRH